jgi:fumarate reductase flavoprotein subunit
MGPHRTGKTVDLEADLVVIGGGGAGLAAAVTAAENGAKNIVVLEARAVPGGNSVFPDSIFAIRSGLPIRWGIDDGRADIFKKAIDYAHGKTSPRVLRALLDKAEDIVGWLEAKGLKFEADRLTHMDQVHMTARACAGGLSTGAAVVKALVKNCEDVGTRIICDARAKKLVTGERGEVVGVLAKTKGGEVKIAARCFVIATGGFAGNKEMLKKCIPSFNDDIHCLGLPHKGDGLKMAAEMGAASDEMLAELAGPDFRGPMRLEIIGKRPETIWVNRRGERFSDEAICSVFPEAANRVCRQPGKVSYTLFDENIKEIILGDKENIDPRYKRALSGADWTAADKDLHLQVKKGAVKIADSWVEIAEWMGAAPEVLRATISEYNGACDQGYDGTFLKDAKYLLPLRTPPYYALRCGVMLLVTHGGIAVNQRMEVLDAQNDPIPGLYAAGVDTGGTDSDTYNVSLRGHSFGFTLNSGRIAGESAADYVGRQRKSGR